MSMKRILICGHKSFAATGLVTELMARGHDAVCFSRGPVGISNNVVTGPIDEMYLNRYLTAKFDVVINYILVKGDDISANIRYIDSLLRFCNERCVDHLIHISSLTVYRSSHRVRPFSKVETDSRNRGAYGAAKIATDNHILNVSPSTLSVSFVRPGFVLGPGLNNPIVGTGIRLPWNEVLAVGCGASQMPLVSRTVLNRAVATIADAHAPALRNFYIIANDTSPTVKEYLRACCTELGCGMGVRSVPRPVWVIAGFAAASSARFLRRSKRPVSSVVKQVARRCRFDPSESERALEMSFGSDWVADLRQSANAQQQNYSVPELRATAPPLMANINKVSFVGFGAIVRQKHLPALRQLGFTGEICAYDPYVTAGGLGDRVTSIEAADLRTSDLVIVASPGRAHTESLSMLSQQSVPVVVEKPLCYSHSELEQWMAFAKARTGPVIVCHNYRYKENVLRMIHALSTINAGALHHVHVHFDSPPIGDVSSWRQRERQSRTLLMDFGIHFLDVACMFGAGVWKVQQLRYELNSRKDTSFIQGVASASNYSVSFFIRQRFGPRKARVEFVFQNYLVSLGFFPDTCTFLMANENVGYHWKELIESLRSSVFKACDKVLNRDSDRSHARVFRQALALNPAALGVHNLESFYRGVFNIGDQVYGSEHPCVASSQRQFAERIG